DVWRAAGALHPAGFRARHGYSPRQRRSYLRTEDEYNLCRDDGAMVELHWELLPGTRSPLLDVESLRRRGISIELAGRRIPTLAHEDHLLLLAAHAAKHLWRTARVVADFAGLIHAADALDWDRVLERANAAGQSRVLLVSLALAHDLLDANVPSAILRMAQEDATVAALTHEIGAT